MNDSQQDEQGQSEQNEQEKDEQIRQQVGLCVDCAYTHQVVSAKGSQFFYCTRAESNARYTKYPRLPVVSCTGYHPAR